MESCEYCGAKAEYIATKYMQPAPPRYVCDKCRRNGMMMLKDLRSRAEVIRQS